MVYSLLMHKTVATSQCCADANNGAKNDVQNQKFKCYFFLAMLFIHLNCVSMSCKVLEILAVEICLPSLEYNGTKWLKIHSENSTVMSLSRNHDAVTQDNPQTIVASSFLQDLFSLYQTTSTNRITRALLRMNLLMDEMLAI